MLFILHLQSHLYEYISWITRNARVIETLPQPKIKKRHTARATKYSLALLYNDSASFYPLHR